MMSRNNSKKLQELLVTHQPNFVLRKLTIGAASVLVGIALVGVNETAKASTSDANTVTTTTTNINNLSAPTSLNNSNTTTDPADAKYDSYEYVYVYAPGNSGSNSNYYAMIANHEITHQTENGQYTNKWSSAEFTSQDLKTVLSNNNFTSKETGRHGNSLPEYSGYHPVITGVHLSNSERDGVPGYTPEEMRSATQKLFRELQAWVDNNPNATAFPAYTIDMPIDVHFNVSYLKNEEANTDNNAVKPSNTEDQTAETPNPPVTTLTAQASTTVSPRDGQINNNHSDEQLPQTGNYSGVALLGLGVAAFLSAVGLVKIRKNKVRSMFKHKN